MKRITAVLFVTAALTGCASGPSYNNVVIDTRDVNTREYSQDLFECRQYADGLPVGNSAAGGAVAGALLGAAVGAIFGNSDLALQVAGAGALYGAADGAGQAAQGQAGIVKECLRGRGYRVLN